MRILSDPPNQIIKWCN